MELVVAHKKISSHFRLGQLQQTRMHQSLIELAVSALA